MQIPAKHTYFACVCAAMHVASSVFRPRNTQSEKHAKVEGEWKRENKSSTAHCFVAMLISIGEEKKNDGTDKSIRLNTTTRDRKTERRTNCWARILFSRITFVAAAAFFSLVSFPLSAAVINRWVENSQTKRFFSFSFEQRETFSYQTYN